MDGVVLKDGVFAIHGDDGRQQLLNAGGIGALAVEFGFICHGNPSSGMRKDGA